MFSSTEAHAFRALAHLAAAEGRGWILGRKLAESADVPQNYLSKILLALNKAGIVEATRGHRGGYRLRRPASEISLAEVLAVFAFDDGKPACFLGGSRVCSDSTACPAHDRWKRVREAYVDFTENTTLADIAHASLPGL